MESWQERCLNTEAVQKTAELGGSLAVIHPENPPMWRFFLVSTVKK